MGLALAGLRVEGSVKGARNMAPLVAPVIVRSSRHMAAAASPTASNTFVYPVQRHRLPLRPRRTSSSVGSGCSSMIAFGRDDHARNAVPALGGGAVGERLLHGMQGLQVAEAALDHGTPGRPEMRERQIVPGQPFRGAQHPRQWLQPEAESFPVLPSPRARKPQKAMASWPNDRSASMVAAITRKIAVRDHVPDTS